MKTVSQTEAKEIIREANMICSMEHGHMVLVSKENPYKKVSFDFPSESTCWVEEHETGKVLKIEVEKKVTLVAFSLLK